MKVLIGCESSGVVRDAFLKIGHEAISCDLLPSERPGPHVQGGGVLELIKHERFDLAIFHPPCTDLAVSGARWFKEKRADGRQQRALAFVEALLGADIPRIALENPVSVISTYIQKPSQYIQPWQYGHGETKRTGLWLKNLPLLKPTKIVEGREQRVWKMGPSPERWRERSRTLEGIAEAMATQWGRE